MVGLWLLALGFTLPGLGSGQPRSESGCERWLDRPTAKKKAQSFLTEVHTSRTGQIDVVLLDPKKSLGVELPGAFLFETRTKDLSSAQGLVTVQMELAEAVARPASPIAEVEQLQNADFALLLVPMKAQDPSPKPGTGFFSGLMEAGAFLVDFLTMGFFHDDLAEDLAEQDAESAAAASERLHKALAERRARVATDPKLARTYSAIFKAVEDGRLKFWNVGDGPGRAVVTLDQQIPAREGATCTLQESWEVPVDYLQGQNPALAVDRAFPLSLTDLAARPPTSSTCQCEWVMPD